MHNVPDCHFLDHPVAPKRIAMFDTGLSSPSADLVTVTAEGKRVRSRRSPLPEYNLRHLTNRRTAIPPKFGQPRLPAADASENEEKTPNFSDSSSSALPPRDEPTITSQDVRWDQLETPPRLAIQARGMGFRGGFGSVVDGPSPARLSPADASGTEEKSRKTPDPFDSSGSALLPRDKPVMTSQDVRWQPAPGDLATPPRLAGQARSMGFRGRFGSVVDGTSPARLPTADASGNEAEMPRDEPAMTSQDVRRQVPDDLATPPRLADQARGVGFRGGFAVQDLRMMVSRNGGDDHRAGPAPSIMPTPEKTPLKPNRFVRQATPTLPAVPASPVVTPPATTPLPTTGPIELGPYADYFRGDFFASKKVKFFDSHTHVDFALSKLENCAVTTYGEMRERYREIFPPSYGGAVQVFCHPSALRKPDLWAKRIIQGSEGQLYLAFGLHPNWADQWDDGVRKGLEENLRRGKACGRLVALGEIGLDYSRTNKTDDVRQQQKTAFADQLDLAKRENLPVIIHCRCDEGATGNDQAEIDCLALCVQHLDASHKIHRHCFTGSYEQADRWRDQFPNVVFGFTPPRGGRSMPASDAIKSLPLSTILLETDAPYFIPTGMSNFPADYSGRVAAIPGGLALVTAVEIAKLRSESVIDVIVATNETILYVYGITVV